MAKIDDLLHQMGDKPSDGNGHERNIVFEKQDVNALKNQVELDALTIKNKLKSEELASRQQDREQRKRYAQHSLWFLMAYMAVVFFIVIVEGFGWRGFHLEYGVMIALITTMTASVIGIFAFVMKYLFSTNEQKKQ